MITAFFYTDIDECALGITGCSQICTNTYGSYFCDCYLGYKISFNNQTCMGKHIASNINFYVVMKHEYLQFQCVCCPYILYVCQ